jgi:cell wall-associated NlpC family hydrolase
VTPRDFEGYVGIPWRDGGRTRDGIDCWGLFRLVYREVLGIELPSFGEYYTTALDRIVIRKLVDGGMDNWQEVLMPDPGDGALLTIAGRVHIGVVVGNDYMLHIEKGAGSVIENYYSMRIQNMLEGFYRYTP